VTSATRVLAFARGVGLLLATGCSTGPASPAPGFGSPESAAAYLVLRPRERKESRTVILNVPPGVDVSAPALRAELRAVADEVVLWRSDSLYGGAARRSQLANAGGQYLVLDLRRMAPMGPDSLVVEVQEERCPGWPCHATHRVLVSRESSGFVPLTLRTLNID
jgi:hypothetical protein